MELVLGHREQAPTCEATIVYEKWKLRKIKQSKVLELVVRRVGALTKIRKCLVLVSFLCIHYRFPHVLWGL